MGEVKTTPTKDLILLSLQTGKAIVDDERNTWNQIIEQILQKKGSIIALRGAGSVNGMDPTEINSLMITLISRIRQIQASGLQVTLLFDGDADAPEKPDIGYVAGRLRDEFNGLNNVSFITAQKKSWYYPTQEGGNLENATGKPYATYIFEDGKYLGDHNAFTQDERLVASPLYEQWYIGASGSIADSQLQDFNDKVPKGQKRKVTFFRVRNNKSLDNEISAKLSQAQSSKDEIKIAKFQKHLIQRENIYGVHFNNLGELIILRDQYPNLEI